MKAWLALFILITGFTSFPAHGAFHVMIDPGHGGSDNGASRGNIKEKDIALKVSLKLADLLRQDARFQTSLTRSTDHKVSLTKRTRLADESKADLFISIHLNSSTDSKAKGAEIYFQNQLPADEESMLLVSQEHEQESDDDSATPDISKPEPLSVKSDLKRILEDLHRNHRILTSSEFSKLLLDTIAAKGGSNRSRRGIRQAPFQVVTSISVPSVLVELGFLTHPQEGPRLNQDDYQTELAKTLYEGLVKYKETIDNEAAKHVNNQAQK